MEEDLLGVFELELSNPAVRLDEAKNRVATVFDASLRVRGVPRAYTGRAGLSGLPRYDAERRAFFLADASVEELEIDGLPRSVASQLRGLAQTLAPDLFETTPLYALRPGDGRLFGSELTATGIRIVGDRLTVDLAPKR